MDAILSSLGLSWDGVTPLWLAIGLGIIAAGATLIGWLLAAVRAHWPLAVQGSALVLAALAMFFLTTTELLPEAFDAGVSNAVVLASVGVGVAVVILLSRLGRRFTSRHSPLAVTGMVAAVAIGLHNIPEGAITVGMSTISLGVAVTATLVIAAHNVPEGLAVAAPIIAAGAGRRKALFAVALVTAGEIAGVLIAAQFAVALAGPGIGVLLSFVSGIMLAVSTMELLPSGLALIRQAARRAIPVAA